MSHYQIGYCPQCNAQILVQDSNGRWNSMKPNYAELDVRMDDGHLFRTSICKPCKASPDNKKILSAVLHKESQAGGEQVKSLKNRAEAIEKAKSLDGLKKELNGN